MKKGIKGLILVGIGLGLIGCSGNDVEQVRRVILSGHDAQIERALNNYHSCLEVARENKAKKEVCEEALDNVWESLDRPDKNRLLEISD